MPFTIANRGLREDLNAYSQSSNDPASIVSPIAANFSSSYQAPILSMTSMAHENYAFVWLKLVPPVSSLIEECSRSDHGHKQRSDG